MKKRILPVMLLVALAVSLTINFTTMASRYAFGDRDGWLRSNKEADGEIMIHEGKKSFIDAGVFDDVVQLNNDINQYNQALYSIIELKGKITIGSGDVGYKIQEAIDSDIVSHEDAKILYNYVTKISMPTLQALQDTQLSSSNEQAKLYIEEFDVELRSRATSLQNDLVNLSKELEGKMNVLPGDNAN